MDDIKLTGLYDVHNPWGETDPVTLRGIAPRIDGLAGKTIGLFATQAKLAAVPIMEAVERKLREREPSLEFSWFVFDHNLNVAESDDFQDFKEWAKGVDAAVAAVGD
ncbi:MAG: hypothetical protein QGH73_02095 [Rhodospirillales bacterium]|jgi:hypothetical protein|nr:hypothetical protein [Rhodospirillaceae bacterium]MDP6429217.1 hypothetical protein [Rhodospirillales bacterium]MDP6644872.1 hypothetical protein [Rhodospirillales bacterium]MDP6840446.1 hypothetical protein [Rhodospirillales bacterium]|tara:strand:+ start:319 stop:639 length:321 start_codon:yes stop_codon:yes gene_type:complete